MAESGSLRDRFADLRSFLELEEGWDSYGGKPTTRQAVDTAEALSFVPTSRGGVQVELHAGGADVEIEISSTGKVVGVVWEAADR